MTQGELRITSNEEWRKLSLEECHAYHRRWDEALPVVELPDDLDFILREPSTIQHLSYELGKYDLSRRDIGMWLEDQLLSFHGDVWLADGTVVEYDEDDVTRAFNGDGSFRWFGDFLLYGDYPPLQRTQARAIPRLRYLYAAIVIQESHLSTANSKYGLGDEAGLEITERLWRGHRIASGRPKAPLPPGFRLKRQPLHHYDAEQDWLSPNLMPEDHYQIAP